MKSPCNVKIPDGGPIRIKKYKRAFDCQWVDMKQNGLSDSERGSNVENIMVSPEQAMGLNDNLEFLGRELHVQTENAAFPSPHITTQVFSRGRIMLSRKSDYPADIRSAADQEKIQNLMRRQHLEVLREISEKQRKIKGGQ